MKKIHIIVLLVILLVPLSKVSAQSEPTWFYNETGSSVCTQREEFSKPNGAWKAGQCPSGDNLYHHIPQEGMCIQKISLKGVPDNNHAWVEGPCNKDEPKPTPTSTPTPPPPPDEDEDQDADQNQDQDTNPLLVLDNTETLPEQECPECLGIDICEDTRIWLKGERLDFQDWFENLFKPLIDVLIKYIESLIDN